MILLNEALHALQGLIANQSISIVNKVLENVNGFPKETITETETFAHIQPLNPSELVKITNGTIDSTNNYKFYCIGNLAQVLSSVSKTDAEVIWNESRCRVFYKEDWSLNGWIMVIGSQLT